MSGAKQKAILLLGIGALPERFAPVQADLALAEGWANDTTPTGLATNMKTMRCRHHWRTLAAWLLLASLAPANGVRGGDVDVTPVGQWTWPNKTPSAVSVMQSGDYAYLVDSVSGLVVIDVRDPGSPQFLGGCDTGNAANGVTVVGQYAYLTDYDTGLHVIDISNPANPRAVATFHRASPRGVAIRGNYA